MLEQLDNRQRRVAEWNSPFAESAKREAAIRKNLKGLGFKKRLIVQGSNWHLADGRRWSQIVTTAPNLAVANCDRMVEVPIWHLKTGCDAVTFCDRIAHTKWSQVATTLFMVTICDLRDGLV